MDIDSLVQEKIDADVDFQASIVDLPDDEKEIAITTKKSEVLSQEFTFLKERADAKEKADELANNYKIRAEKAEADAKKNSPAKGKDDELTPKDVYALMNAKVAEEDIEQVADYAKFKKISVAEALKSTVVKTMLEESAEQRTTAQATQTRGGARGTSKVTGADILAEAEKTGQLPDSEAEIQALFLARQARRKTN